MPKLLGTATYKVDGIRKQWKRYFKS